MARRLALVASLAALAVATAAQPAGAATREVKVADFEFTPGSVTIAQQDTVNWRFAGPDTNHSVTSNPPGQAESFDSDPNEPNFLINHPVGFVFPHTFTQVGNFTYFCKVHPGMTGSVNVRPTGSDITAPTTLLGGRRRQDIDKLAIRVRVGEVASVTVTGRVKVRGRRRTFRLKRLTKTVVANTSERFRMRLRRRSKRRIKRAIRRGRRATARLKIVAMDRAGNTTVKRRRIRLRP